MPKGKIGYLSPYCSKCKKVKELEKQRYCRKCKTEYIKNWRIGKPLTEEQRLKGIVRRKTTMRVQRGLLEKKPCEICDSTTKIEAHHLDYSKTYDVIWMCFVCHRELHRCIRYVEGLRQ